MDTRDYTEAVAFPDPIEIRPIGRVRSPYRQRHGTPKQPGVGVSQQGQVVLEDWVDVNALRDLEGFSHVWLISWFHLNGPRRKPLVRPPRGGPKRGVFSTRAPHRINPIGLSAVRLERVEGRIVYVADLDLLDGTPILDIKPYIARFDAHPKASAGWLDHIADTAAQSLDKLPGSALE